MTYHTDSAIIKHIYNDILPKIMEKYQFTEQEIFTLSAAKKIMLIKAKEIDKDN